MHIQTKTLALLVVAGGLLASGYLFRPAPGAASTGTVAARAESASLPRPAPAAPAAQAASKVKMMRPPVPLQVGGHDKYFVSAPSDAVATDTQTATATGATASVGDKLLGDAAETNFAAKAAIEQDGYRNVRGLGKTADGVWRGRAMRGSTEISVTVDANGNVSAD